MKVWKDGDAEGITPPNHFGGLTTLDVVPRGAGNYSVQVSKAPPGGGGELHHHDDLAQVFFVMSGSLTFNTGTERFTLQAGEAVLFEPGDPHFTINDGPEVSRTLVITVQQ